MPFCKITFSGSFDELKNLMIKRIPDIKIKKLDEKTAQIQIEADSLEGVYYLKGFELDETRIDNVTEISDSEANLELDIVNKDTSELVKSVILEDTSKTNDKQSSGKKGGNPLENLDKAVFEATLNSKTPLPNEDPFYYITSKSFMVYTFFALSTIMFVSSIL